MTWNKGITQLNNFDLLNEKYLDNIILNILNIKYKNIITDDKIIYFFSLLKKSISLSFKQKKEILSLILNKKQIFKLINTFEKENNCFSKIDKNEIKYQVLKESSKNDWLKLWEHFNNNAMYVKPKYQTLLTEQLKSWINLEIITILKKL